MNIAIVGTGYVGLVSGTCFAEMGAHVTCVDVDAQKIEKLKNGIMPIYEPGLEEMVKNNVECERLQFTTNLTEVLDDVEVVFSAVGTPPDEDGSADLRYVLAVARQFGQNIHKYTIHIGTVFIENQSGSFNACIKNAPSSISTVSYKTTEITLAERLIRRLNHYCPIKDGA